MNTYTLDTKLVDLTAEADNFAKLAEAYGAAVTAFGDAAARIFERVDDVKFKLVGQAVDEFDDQWAAFDAECVQDALNVKLARATSSAKVEEAF